MQSIICQKNSEFYPLKTANVSKYCSLAGKYAENEHFWKSLIVSGFRFLYILLTCQSYALRWSKLCNEVVRAML